METKNQTGQESAQPGSTADYALSDYAGCGELLKKAMRYARTEWPAMKRVLESGDVEVSNNISEQSVRKLKMNLRNAQYRKREFCGGQRLHVLGDRELQTQ